MKKMYFQEPADWFSPVLILASKLMMAHNFTPVILMYIRSMYNTYYFLHIIHNILKPLFKVTFFIQIPFSKFHSDCVLPEQMLEKAANKLLEEL